MNFLAFSLVQSYFVIAYCAASLDQRFFWCITECFLLKYRKHLDEEKNADKNYTNGGQTWTRVRVR